MGVFKYRADIDGLRAIAVLSVVIFHINPKWLPSGFLGVDIFFVLSGFLITSIIYKEMEEGDFSFKEFYIRRIKRILPLFFVVLITGLLACWYIYVPRDLNGVVDSAVAALIFLANRYFARQGGYFDTSSDEKPFLHLWSLSVEEQFYFIFPILLLLIIKISFLKRNILKILGVGVILALLSAFVDLKGMGILRWDVYYLSHIRMGEMLVGSFLAVYCREKRREEKRREEKRREEKRRGRTDLLGGILLMILIVCFFLENVFISPFFPGVLALLPCGVTGLLIYINSQRNWISSFLSLSPIVWLGKISYSLYLWHWIVLALMRYVYQDSELPMSWILISIILMLVLSILTYYGVENPLRKLNLSFGKNLAYFYVIPSGIVLMLAYWIKNNDNKISEYGYPENICHNKVDGNCIKGDINKKPKALFIGNSYMGHLNPWIDKIGKKEGWSAMVISSDSFPFAFDWKGDEKHRFYQYKKIRDEFFIQNYQKFPIIVFHYNVHSNETYNNEEFHQEFVHTLRRLISEGKKVYVITSVVKASKNVPRDYHFLDKGLSFNNIREIGNSSEDILSFIPQDLEVNKVDLRQGVPKTFYIDGKPILADTDHWNTYGAEKMAEIFISKGKRFIKKEDLE